MTGGVGDDAKGKVGDDGGMGGNGARERGWRFVGRGRRMTEGMAPGKGQGKGQEKGRKKGQKGREEKRGK